LVLRSVASIATVPALLSQEG